MDYNKFPILALVDSLPEYTCLLKVGGLWSVYHNGSKGSVLEQLKNEDLKQFLVRYYVFLSKFESHKNMEKIHINLDASNASNVEN